MCCCCGRRYFVVLLIFIGYLVSIGSREMFTFVMTNVVSKGVSTESLFKGLKCKAGNTTDIHQDWSSSDRFYTQTVYFIGNLITQLPGGMLAVKFSSTKVSGVSIFGSSVLWFVMYVALRYDLIYLVFVLRAIQGLFEGTIVPAFNGVLAAWAPPNERSTMVTISYAGAYLSPAVASVVTGLLLCLVGTAAPLFIYGGVGVVWSLIWLIAVSNSPSKCKCISEEELAVYNQKEQKSHGTPVQFTEVPWRHILTSLPVSAIVVAAFCRNWIFALLITQVPTYYHDVYNMDSLKQGIWSSLPHIFMVVVVISIGFLADNLIKREILSVTVTRKAAETIGFGVEASCLMALGFIKNEKIAIVLLCVGVAVSGFAISGYQVNALDLAPRYTAVITGIVRLGVIGSVISTTIAGRLTKNTDKVQGWKHVFIVAASIHFAGVLWYLLFASGSRQSWASQHENLEASINYTEAQNVAEPQETDELIASYDFKDSLFSKSMALERGALEELETSNWYMSSFPG